MSSTRATWRPAPRPPTSPCMLVDARKGVLTQTRRHACIVSLLGIRAGRARRQQDGSRRFRPGALRRDRRRVHELRRASSAFERVTPSRSRRSSGDNVIDAEPAHAAGITARRCCGTSRRSMSSTRPRERPFRFPVQWVNRPHLDFRGYRRDGGERQRTRRRRGGGRSRPASARTSPASSPPTAISSRRAAGNAVTLTFAEEVDVSRGDVLAHRRARRRSPIRSRRTIVWFDEEPMLPGRTYTLKCGCQTTTGDGHRASNTSSMSTISSMSPARRSS